MRLLIVDDSNMIRQAIESWLVSQNHEVVGQARNGVEALELFKQHKPDIVTLDITMPEMDGLEALEKMKALDSGARIIIISALASKEVAIEALKKGAATFVQKPITKQDLVDAIAEVM